MTHDEVLKFALDGTDAERQLAHEIIEARGERYAIHRRLIDALHRIEALEKPAPSAPANPIGVAPPPGCTCDRAWWGVIPPPACPVHGIAPALWSLIHERLG